VEWGKPLSPVKDERRTIEILERRLAVAGELHLIRERARIAQQLSLWYQRLGELDKAIAALQICVAFERAIHRQSESERYAAEIDSLRALLKQ
jgi:hypothetical protein